MKNFWSELKCPFTVLAPMDGVTDVVFREIVGEIGRPDVFFTEFANVDGLNSRGAVKVKERLRFVDNQQPIVAQIWGKDPEAFEKSAGLCRELNFSGIDINMGCPDRAIVNKGSCAALLRNSDLAGEIISATKKGAGGVPVSVKTRLGFLQQDMDWIKFILQQGLSALTIHLRTVDEMSKVPAHWEVMSEIMKLRDEIAPATIIIGNGDILSLQEIEEKFEKFHCNGFMVGRGIFQNPWIFNKSVDVDRVAISDRLDLFIRHINLFDKTWKDKNPSLLKKFCKTYVHNFADASSLRERIMECKKTSEMIEVLSSYKDSNLS